MVTTWWVVDVQGRTQQIFCCKDSNITTMDSENVQQEMSICDFIYSVEELCRENENLQQHISSLEKDIGKCCATMVEVKQTQDSFTTNIWELLKATKVQLERKNNKIANLEAKISCRNNVTTASTSTEDDTQIEGPTKTVDGSAHKDDTRQKKSIDSTPCSSAGESSVSRLTPGNDGSKFQDKSDSVVKDRQHSNKQDRISDRDKTKTSDRRHQSCERDVKKNPKTQSEVPENSGSQERREQEYFPKVQPHRDSTDQPSVTRDNGEKAPVTSQEINRENVEKGKEGPSKQVSEEKSSTHEGNVKSTEKLLINPQQQSLKRKANESGSEKDSGEVRSKLSCLEVAVRSCELRSAVVSETLNPFFDQMEIKEDNSDNDSKPGDLSDDMSLFFPDDVDDDWDSDTKVEIDPVPVIAAIKESSCDRDPITTFSSFENVASKFFNKDTAFPKVEAATENVTKEPSSEISKENEVTTSTSKNVTTEKPSTVDNKNVIVNTTSARFEKVTTNVTGTVLSKISSQDGNVTVQSASKVRDKDAVTVTVSTNIDSVAGNPLIKISNEGVLPASACLSKDSKDAVTVTTASGVENVTKKPTIQINRKDVTVGTSDIPKNISEELSCKISNKPTTTTSGSFENVNKKSTSKINNNDAIDASVKSGNVTTKPSNKIENKDFVTASPTKESTGQINSKGAVTVTPSGIQISNKIAVTTSASFEKVTENVTKKSPNKINNKDGITDSTSARFETVTGNLTKNSTSKISKKDAPTVTASAKSGNITTKSPDKIENKNDVTTSPAKKTTSKITNKDVITDTTSDKFDNVTENVTKKSTSKISKNDVTTVTASVRSGNVTKNVATKSPDKKIKDKDAVIITPLGIKISNKTAVTTSASFENVAKKPLNKVSNKDAITATSSSSRPEDVTKNVTKKPTNQSNDKDITVATSGNFKDITQVVTKEPSSKISNKAAVTLSVNFEKSPNKIDNQDASPHKKSSSNISDKGVVNASANIESVTKKSSGKIDLVVKKLFNEAEKKKSQPPKAKITTEIQSAVEVVQTASSSPSQPKKTPIELNLDVSKVVASKIKISQQKETESRANGKKGDNGEGGSINEAVTNIESKSVEIVKSDKPGLQVKGNLLAAALVTPTKEVPTKMTGFKRKLNCDSPETREASLNLVKQLVSREKQFLDNPVSVKDGNQQRKKIRQPFDNNSGTSEDKEDTNKEMSGNEEELARAIRSIMIERLSDGPVRIEQTETETAKVNNNLSNRACDAKKTAKKGTETEELDVIDLTASGVKSGKSRGVTKVVADKSSRTFDSKKSAKKGTKIEERFEIASNIESSDTDNNVVALKSAQPFGPVRTVREFIKIDELNPVIDLTGFDAESNNNSDVVNVAEVKSNQTSGSKKNVKKGAKPEEHPVKVAEKTVSNSKGSNSGVIRMIAVRCPCQTGGSKTTMKKSAAIEEFNAVPVEHPLKVSEKTVSNSKGSSTTMIAIKCPWCQTGPKTAVKRGAAIEELNAVPVVEVAASTKSSNNSGVAVKSSQTLDPKKGTKTVELKAIPAVEVTSSSGAANVVADKSYRPRRKCSVVLKKKRIREETEDEGSNDDEETEDVEEEEVEDVFKEIPIVIEKSSRVLRSAARKSTETKEKEPPKTFFNQKKIESQIGDLGRVEMSHDGEIPELPVSGELDVENNKSTSEQHPANKTLSPSNNTSNCGSFRSQPERKRRKIISFIMVG